jgi:hypothetical protein
VNGGDWWGGRGELDSSSSSIEGRRESGEHAPRASRPPASRSPPLLSIEALSRAPLLPSSSSSSQNTAYTNKREQRGHRVRDKAWKRPREKRGAHLPLAGARARERKTPRSHTSARKNKAPPLFQDLSPKVSKTHPSPYASGPLNCLTRQSWARPYPSWPSCAGKTRARGPRARSRPRGRTGPGATRCTRTACPARTGR